MGSRKVGRTQFSSLPRTVEQCQNPLTPRRLADGFAAVIIVVGLAPRSSSSLMMPACCWRAWSEPLPPPRWSGRPGAAASIRILFCALGFAPPSSSARTAGNDRVRTARCSGDTPSCPRRWDPRRPTGDTRSSRPVPPDPNGWHPPRSEAAGPRADWPHGNPRRARRGVPRPAAEMRRPPCERRVAGVQVVGDFVEKEV